MNLPNLPFWSQSDKMTVVRIPANQARKIVAKDGYWRLRLIEMRLGRDWVFTTILHPAMFIEYSAFEKSIQTVVGPKQFGQLRGDLRLVHLEPQVVIPPLPHNGNLYDVGIALVSVPGKDLAEGMLNLLADLSEIIGVNNVLAAVKLTDILRQGINTIIGINECKMQLGWMGQVGQFDTIEQGYILIAPPGIANLLPSDCTVVGGRLQVHGQDLSRMGYLLFSIEVANRRPDWEELPGIKETLNRFNVAINTNAATSEYQKCVDDLLIAVRTSPFLVSTQCDEIIDNLIILKNKSQSQRELLLRSETDTVSAKVINDLRQLLLPLNSGDSEFYEDEAN